MATVSSAAELKEALKSGGTIELEDGDYGAVELSGVKGATIRSDGGATFQKLMIKGSDNVSFDNIRVEAGGGGNKDITIDVRKSHGITFNNSEFVGNDSSDDLVHAPRGFQVDGESSGIEISDSHIHHFSRAGIFFASDIKITGNLIDDIGFDGLFFGKSNNVLIEGNTLTDFYRSGSVHADYIQFDPGTTGAASNVTIRGNVLLKGNGNGDVQGIFGANHHQDKHGTVFENILVEDNVYFDTGLNAVQFETGNNITIRNNTVLMDPSDGRKNWIRLHDDQKNGVIENNIATQISAEDGARESGNIVAQYDNEGGDNYYGDLFANVFTDKPSLDDLKHVSGTLDGKGASMLGGGGSSPRNQGRGEEDEEEEGDPDDRDENDEEEEDPEEREEEEDEDDEEEWEEENEEEGLIMSWDRSEGGDELSDVFNPSGDYLSDKFDFAMIDMDDFLVS